MGRRDCPAQRPGAEPIRMLKHGRATKFMVRVRSLPLPPSVTRRTKERVLRGIEVVSRDGVTPIGFWTSQPPPAQPLVRRRNPAARLRCSGRDDVSGRVRSDAGLGLCCASRKRKRDGDPIARRRMRRRFVVGVDPRCRAGREGLDKPRLCAPRNLGPGRMRSPTGITKDIVRYTSLWKRSLSSDRGNLFWPSMD